MIKRDITETVYEYDKNGVLTKKTVTETHETDDETRYWNYGNSTTTPHITTTPPTTITPYYTTTTTTDINTNTQN